MTPYHIIIAASLIIILSFLFNVLSRKTNIPSVLMLIGLGAAIQSFLWQPAKGSVVLKMLEIIGSVGLIFIVLEAALDLKLKKEKLDIILKSFFSALFSLVICSFVIAGLFSFFWMDATYLQLLLYAVPLSIMSSAIIIPSVQSLPQHKKEFMIYESTFSDVLGIMFFFFLKGNAFAETAFEVVKGVSINILVTIFVSVLASYLLVWLCRQVKTKIKYFLLFAVLLLLYSFGKEFHLSSLLLILFFGLVMNNAPIFSFGKMKNWFNGDGVGYSNDELHTITLETSFVLRTGFFVLFGITIPLASLFDLKLALISILVIVILFLVRFILLFLFKGTKIIPELWIAPRGLITILLFFGIPNGFSDHQGKILSAYDAKYDFTIADFGQGILLYTILMSSVVMAISLIKNKEGKVTGGNLLKNLSEVDGAVIGELEATESSNQAAFVSDDIVSASAQEHEERKDKSETDIGELEATKSPNQAAFVSDDIVSDSTQEHEERKDKSETDIGELEATKSPQEASVSENTTPSSIQAHEEYEEDIPTDSSSKNDT